MDVESDLKLDVPLRNEPAITQAGGALIIAGMLLFGLVMPVHSVVLLFLDLCEGKLAAFPFWKILVPLAFLLGFLALGSWMAHGLILCAYETARPGRILLAVAVGSLVAQLVAGLFGYGLTLFLIEVIGIFVCLVAGFVLAKVGKEIAEIVKGHSAGGGLGSLAGLILGYLSCDSQLKMVGCAVAGGVLAEGLGRFIRFAIRRRSKPLPAQATTSGTRHPDENGLLRV